MRHGTTDARSTDDSVGIAARGCLRRSQATLAAHRRAGGLAESLSPNQAKPLSRTPEHPVLPRTTAEHIGAERDWIHRWIAVRLTCATPQGAGPARATAMSGRARSGRARRSHAAATQEPEMRPLDPWIQRWGARGKLLLCTSGLPVARARRARVLPDGWPRCCFAVHPCCGHALHVVSGRRSWPRH